MLLELNHFLCEVGTEKRELDREERERDREKRNRERETKTQKNEGVGQGREGERQETETECVGMPRAWSNPSHTEGPLPCPPQGIPAQRGARRPTRARLCCYHSST